MASYSAVLGIGGGIAAYKAAELARQLMERGFEVNPVMTQAAQEFVRPLTFSALTGRKVITEMFNTASAGEVLASSVEHISLAQQNQILVVAPATADLLARFAHGLANDFLTTLYLAFEGPVVLAPAMNTAMWRHPATQANLQIRAATTSCPPMKARWPAGPPAPAACPNPRASPNSSSTSSPAATTWTARPSW
jgi:phosphopantothenoylcysteine decarboxylase/phosphopantothenate--cysteine ligase